MDLKEWQAQADRGVAIQEGLFETYHFAIEVRLEVRNRVAQRDIVEVVVSEKNSIGRARTFILSNLERVGWSELSDIEAEAQVADHLRRNVEHRLW